MSPHAPISESIKCADVKMLSDANFPRREHQLAFHIEMNEMRYETMPVSPQS